MYTLTHKLTGCGVSKDTWYLFSINGGRPHFPGTETEVLDFGVEATANHAAKQKITRTTIAVTPSPLVRDFPSETGLIVLI